MILHRIMVYMKKTMNFRNPDMAKKPRRVAVMLDLKWLYNRHVAIIDGIQRYAEERGLWQFRGLRHIRLFLCDANSNSVTRSRNFWNFVDLTGVDRSYQLS